MLIKCIFFLMKKAVLLKKNLQSKLKFNIKFNTKYKKNQINQIIKNVIQILCYKWIYYPLEHNHSKLTQLS